MSGDAHGEQVLMQANVTEPAPHARRRLAESAKVGISATDSKSGGHRMSRGEVETGIPVWSGRGGVG